MATMTRKPAARTSPAKASKGAKSARAKTAKPVKKAASAATRSAKPVFATARIFQVDAFTGRLFHGNPASVLLLDAFPDEDVMQHIAAENHQPMTAFVVGSTKGNAFKIRWFTSTIEMPICGHATLAAAHVLWVHEKSKASKLSFKYAGGTLSVERHDDLIVLDLPAQPFEPIPVSNSLVAALGRRPAELFRAVGVSGNFMAIFDNKRDIHELSPDMDLLTRLDGNVMVTAPGAGHDFVSRFFGPRSGFGEDAASGSPHGMMVPYWAKRLGKKTLRAHQVSRRGGELFCEDRGARVKVAGRAITYMTGTIRVPVES